MDERTGCAIVIGASRGFGFASALALAESGRAVVLAARDASALDDAARVVREHGGVALACPADGTVERDVKRVVDIAVRRFGRIEMLVCAAGAAPVLERMEDGLTWATWRRHIDVDVRSVFDACRRVLPLMRTQRAGTIVNLSSGAVVATSPHHVAYTPAKLAVVGLSRVLATEAGADGVTVHCLCPDITPDGEVGRLAIETFARERGVTPDEWLASFGPQPPSSASVVGEAVVELIGKPSGVWHVGGAGLTPWELLSAPVRSPVPAPA